jgi:hypothetical protein
MVKDMIFIISVRLLQVFSLTKPMNLNDKSPFKTKYPKAASC